MVQETIYSLLSDSVLLVQQRFGWSCFYHGNYFKKIGTTG